jgi:hypothetical protein
MRERERERERELAFGEKIDRGPGVERNASQMKCRFDIPG